MEIRYDSEADAMYIKFRDGDYEISEENKIYKYNYKPHLTSGWDLTTPRKGICKDRQERYAHET